MKKSTFMIISILLILCLPNPSLSQISCNKNDAKTLLKIKKSLGNPKLLSSWQKTLDCCQWGNIYCNPNTGRVTDLTISSGDISAQIPPEIGHLPYLESLWFYNLTNLYGEIPSSITKLTRLKTLIITHTSLFGPIPSFLSELKNLNFLDLSYNNLTGPIPESLGRLSGDVPYVVLSHNHLTGNVPKSLGYVNFSFLDFSKNQLVGDLSMVFGSNKTIGVADFSGNNFQFNLSKVEFPAKMWYLDLSHNKIYGSLPRMLTRLSLKNLNVSYNRLCGKIPQGGKLQKFDKTSYFHNKCLCGSPLPACS